MWPALASIAASMLSGPDAAPIPQVFQGGDTSWGGSWSVATSGSKASATGSPSAEVASWIGPVVIVAGLVLVLIAATKGGRK